MRVGERGRGQWSVWLVVALLGLATRARAQIFQSIELDVASITVDSPWPGNLIAGWFPVGVRATSLASKPVGLSFEVGEVYGAGLMASGEIRLEPGETRAVYWLIPVHPESTRTAFHITVRTSGGEVASVSLQNQKNVKSLDDSYTLISGARDSHVVSDASNISHDRLPDDWRAYTSLGRMVLVTHDGLPRAEVLEAMRTWVAAGGVLQVVGPTDGLGFPVEQRFDQLTERVILRTGADGLTEAARSPADVLSEQRYGFGSVQVTQEIRTDLAPNWGAGGGMLFQSGQEVVRFGVFPDGLAAIWTPIPGLSALPVGWLTGLLVVFFLVMGPLQFSWLRRRGAPPSRLLITTPLLGLGFAALLLVSSLLAQGLGVKQSVSSISWLDQERHHVSVLAKRTVYSGSVFDSALRYDAGSAVANLTSLRHGQAYRVDLDRQILSGAFLPVRTPTDELLVRSTTARQRVAIENEAGVPYAVSGFETHLADFWYRDESGALFRAEDGLPAGRRVALVAAAEAPGQLGLGLQHLVGSSQEARTFISSMESTNWPLLDQLPIELPKRCYAALMDESPFLDDGGVPRDTILQRHLLVGVLEAAP